jgi:hypothetical protein
VRTVLAILVTASASAQTAPLPAQPAGLVRGVLTENSSAAFAVRTAAGISYQYRADNKTWIERDNMRIRPSALLPGEILEIVSDRDPDPVRYARLVHVISKSAPHIRPFSAGGIYRLNTPGVSVAANPNLTFTGIIAARDGQRLILRTRFDGEKFLYLRQDTQYLHDGGPVDAASLRPNTRVFIVAARNLDREIEAYQVIWGEILEPDQKP